MTNLTKHALVIAGAGPTGVMLAGELALAHVDVAIVERAPTKIADRFLSQGMVTIPNVDVRGTFDH